MVLSDILSYTSGWTICILFVPYLSLFFSFLLICLDWHFNLIIFLQFKLSSQKFASNDWISFFLQILYSSFSLYYLIISFLIHYLICYLEMESMHYFYILMFYLFFYYHLQFLLKYWCFTKCYVLIYFYFYSTVAKEHILYHFRSLKFM
jgi:hypothetical protein